MRPNARPEDAYPLFGGVEDKCELFYETIDTIFGLVSISSVPAFSLPNPLTHQIRSDLALNLSEKRYLYGYTNNCCLIPEAAEHDHRWSQSHAQFLPGV